jgi:hypothetical protein
VNSAFKFKIEKRYVDFPGNIGRRLVEDHSMANGDGVEIKADGAAPDHLLYFRYTEGTVSFRFYMDRDDDDGNPSHSAVVNIGRAQAASADMKRIEKHIEEALLSWPADSYAIAWGGSSKQVPITRVKFAPLVRDSEAREQK